MHTIDLFSNHLMYFVCFPSKMIARRGQNAMSYASVS